jgi:hypothetical protein
MPSGSNKRKRQKIEYVPLSKAVDSFGGYDKEAIALDKKRLPPRSVMDLGAPCLRLPSGQLGLT